jgi:beta-lactamase regulating signal transducer with metallopeptidase domain
MTAITMVADHPLAQALAWALLHFVWQGALLALAAFVLLRTLARSANARYVIGIATLAAMLAAPVVTTAWLAQASGQRASATPGSEVSLAPVAASRGVATVSISPDQAAPFATPGRSSMLTAVILMIWMAGVVGLSIRLLGGWVAARRLARRAVAPASPEIHAMATRLAGRLALRRLVDVAQSTAVAVPIMIGWLKPVVILPTAVLSGFTPEQVEALLVHELAHVRRHDYLVNLLQTMVETVLFYHPAVWWVSGRVRAEREHCCDDLAVEICDRLVYVRALSDLAAMTTPHLAMAASNGSLVARVRRILGRPPAEAEAGSGWLPVFLILALIAPALPVTLASADRTPAPVSAATPAAVQSTAPAPGTQLAATESTASQGTVSTSQTVVQKTPPAAREFEVQAQQQADEIRRLEEALKKWTEAQKELDAKRFDLNLAQHDTLMKARIDELVTALHKLQMDFERAKQQVDVGLAPKEVVSDLELKIKQTESAIVAAQAQSGFEAMRLRLDQAGVEQQHEWEKLMREYALHGYPPAQPGKMELAETTELVNDPAATIKVNDVLEVRITGEPQLPPLYTVDTNGAIRLPFMSAIRVEGLTAKQAGEAIAKQLADRHLVTSPSVFVSLRRPR